MMIENVRGLIEDFALGALCTATWVQDHGKGWITFLLAVVYGVYKIISQRKATKGQDLDNEIKQLDKEIREKQLKRWDSARQSIEGDLEAQLRELKQAQIK